MARAGCGGATLDAVLLADAMALLHGAAVLFMLTGSLLALRWPGVLWLHVPVGLTIAVLYLSGSDCPLTTWELALREDAGEPGYRGGFIGHYVTEPLGFPIEATSTQVSIATIAVLPNVVGYGSLAGRQLRAWEKRSIVTGPGRRAAPPRPPAQASPRSRRRPRELPRAALDRRRGVPGPRT